MDWTGTFIDQINHYIDYFEISGNGGQVQNIEYTYDGLGNLLSRNNISSGINQIFEYDDDLNRLEAVTGFKLGNIMDMHFCWPNKLQHNGHNIMDRHFCWPNKLLH